MSEKTYFSLFANDGEKKDQTTFRVFQKGGAYEDVTADYRVSGTSEPAPKGSAIKAKSQAGNNVIRVNVGVGNPTHFYRGTLNFNEFALKAFKAGEAQPKGERAGVFGTVTDKDGTEMDVSGWVQKDKNGKFYISCTLQEPFKKGDAAAAPAAAGAAADLEDSIPF